MIRIIAGERRGQKIDGPKGVATRPTSDLVRESLFNILREAIVDRVVVDLFAGTGALGLEALSRGAARAIFVEQKRENVALIYRNLATLRYEDRATVLPTDAYRWMRSFQPTDDQPIVVLLDPPYREYDLRAKLVNKALVTLVGKLPVGSLVAVESGKTLNERILPEFEEWDVRRYGGTHVAVLEVGEPRAGAESPLEAEDDIEAGESGRDDGHG